MRTPVLSALPLLLCLTPAAAGPLTATEIVGQLSGDRYVADLDALVGFGTRYYTTAGNALATDYIRDAFTAMGLMPVDHRFTHNGYALRNIEATLTGVSRPDEVYLLGAHFDSIASRSPGGPSTTTAPGANDNASGTAGLLEIARVLSRYRFDATIRFVGFNAEEQGMIGSFAYAADAKTAGTNIRGMVNLDMIGFSFAGDDLVAIGNDWLVDLLVANTRAFVPVTATYDNNPRWSDHEPFSTRNYLGSASVMAIGDQINEIWGSNPYYHRVTDTISPDRFDPAFALGASRGAAATMIALAGLRQPVPAPAVWLLLAPGLVWIGWRGRTLHRRCLPGAVR